MFSNKERTTAQVNFEKQYCKGFNVGVSLLKAITKDQEAQTKELLHLMILARPKDISYHATLAGFSYEIERIRSREKLKTMKRMAEMESINEKTQDKDQEQTR
jgi:hypothetical protein